MGTLGRKKGGGEVMEKRGSRKGGLEGDAHRWREKKDRAYSHISGSKEGRVGRRKEKVAEESSK